MALRLTVVALVVGCTGHTVAIDDWATRYLSAYCEYETACELFPDVATCEGSLPWLGTAQDATLVEDVMSGVVKYDSSAAASCIDYVAATSCTWLGRPDPENPCLRVFQGTVAVGSQCFIDAECAGAASYCGTPATICDIWTSCCPGRCVAAPTQGVIGAACSTSSDCAADLYCSNKTAQCTAVASQVGAECEASDGCANPLACDLNNSTNVSTCVALPTTGATCNLALQYPQCADTRDWCDPGPADFLIGTCSRIVSPGSSCAPVNEAFSAPRVPCVPYASCDTSTQTCVAQPGPGEPCMNIGTSGGASNCYGLLFCNSGVCQLPATTPTVCR